MSALSCDEVRDLAAGFVLGALDPATMHDVRDHLATCPEPHPEMAELGGVVPYLAESVEPAEPPVELRGRIMAAIEAEVRASERTDAAADRLVASFAEPAAAPASSAAVAPAPVGAQAPADASSVAPQASERTAAAAGATLGTLAPGPSARRSASMRNTPDVDRPSAGWPRSPRCSSSCSSGPGISS